MGEGHLSKLVQVVGDLRVVEAPLEEREGFLPLSRSQEVVVGEKVELEVTLQGGLGALHRSTAPPSCTTPSYPAQATSPWWGRRGRGCSFGHFPRTGLQRRTLLSSVTQFIFNDN